jgi:hypothetical protein
MISPVLVPAASVPHTALAVIILSTVTLALTVDIVAAVTWARDRWR